MSIDSWWITGSWDFGVYMLPSLFSQDLSDNRIGLEGVAALTDVMTNTNNLKKLVLQGESVLILLFMQ